MLRKRELTPNSFVYLFIFVVLLAYLQISRVLSFSDNAYSIVIVLFEFSDFEPCFVIIITIFQFRTSSWLLRPLIYYIMPLLACKTNRPLMHLNISRSYRSRVHRRSRTIITIGYGCFDFSPRVHAYRYAP